MSKIETYIIQEVDKKENARRFHPLPKLAENLFKVKFFFSNDDQRRLLN